MCMALVSVVETPGYLRDAEKVLTKEEREAVIDAVAEFPMQGALIQGTGGLRKMRIGFGDRGKRGGGRVVYWFHSEGYPIVLLAMFAKNESSDLTAVERSILVKVAGQLLNDFQRRAK